MQSLAAFTPAAPLKAHVLAPRINALDLLSVPLVLTQLLERGDVIPCAAIRSPDFPRRFHAAVIS